MNKERGGTVLDMEQEYTQKELREEYQLCTAIENIYEEHIGSMFESYDKAMEALEIAIDPRSRVRAVLKTHVENTLRFREKEIEYCMEDWAKMKETKTLLEIGLEIPINCGVCICN